MKTNTDLDKLLYDLLCNCCGTILYVSVFITCISGPVGGVMFIISFILPVSMLHLLRYLQVQWVGLCLSSVLFYLPLCSAHMGTSGAL